MGKKGSDLMLLSIERDIPIDENKVIDMYKQKNFTIVPPATYRRKDFRERLRRPALKTCNDFYVGPFF